MTPAGPGARPRPAPRGTTATAAGLVARTWPLPRMPDLVAVGGRPDGVLWQREDMGLAGAGTALRIPLPAGLDDPDLGSVAATLSAIAVEDAVGEPGCGPVAVGALPFHRGAPAHLSVPRWVVGRRGEQAWLTVVDGAGTEVQDPVAALCDLEGGGPGGDPPDSFTLVPADPHSCWKDKVAAAVGVIAGGGPDRLDKVVLARRVDVSANRPFVVPDVLARLAALYPACMVFHVGGFLGASPELLLERRGPTVRSYPLAGTVARSGDVASDERLISALLASDKERSEHGFVVDGIAAALAPVCAALSVPDRPDVLGLRNVSHLATPISGLLRGDPPPSALDLVARVHPTPAVAGTPTARAVRYLSEVEGFDRRTFAGPVGWMDHRGDGSWALGIRSASVSGSEASMYAGVGVVADSDPAAELAETQLKLQALLAALVRP